MASKPPQCFFCGGSLESHRNNAQGHVWRKGSRVEPEDFMRADDATQGLHRSFCEDQWRRRGLLVSRLSVSASAESSK